MQLSRKRAQQIVEQIGSLVKQNINMMDETGQIIASTDPLRLGNFHEGAYQIITQHLSELYISPRQETATVRQGINLPLEFQGDVVGVIGITGGYDEVFAYGQIVKHMTQILLRERYDTEQKILDSRVWTRFLEDWILGTGLLNAQNLSERGFALGINIMAPRRVLVVSPKNIRDYTGNFEGQKLIEQVEKTVAKSMELVSGSIILRNTARQIILIPKQREDTARALAQKLQADVKAVNGISLIVGIDGRAADPHTAYLQANRAWNIAAHRQDSIAAYEELGLELVMDDIPDSRKLELLHKVFPGQTASQIRDHVVLLNAYFAAEGSLAAAADALFIHKNTFQYRLRKLAEECGLDVRRPSQASLLQLAMLFFLDLENQPGFLDF